MTISILWNSISCDFYENDTVVVLVEEANDQDLGTDHPKVLGPRRTQTYDVSVVPEVLTAESWTYHDVTWTAPEGTEAEAVAAWEAYVAPEEEPPPE